MPRTNEKDLQKLLKRPGYGIQGGIGKGIQGTVNAGAALTKVGGSGEEHDMESTAHDESLAAKKLQVGCSGKPEIRIEFRRHRLADHHRAISEKALVDSLQYAGLIAGDSQEEIRLTDVIQTKVGTDQEEETIIMIDYPEVDYDNLWVKAKKNLAR